MSSREPVFVASGASEADRVESVLEEEGIEFTQRLEPSLQDTSNRICYMGVLFEVAADDVERCKRILTERGFARGILGTPRE